MIYDDIKNYRFYELPEAFEKAFIHFGTLTPDVANGRYELVNNALWVNIDSYESKAVSLCKPEAHREFIDMQILLTGEESIVCYPSGVLKVREPYDGERDVEFYENSFTASPYVPKALLELVPGRFAIFFPHDIHMPQILLHKVCRVKKAVYKIKISSIEEPFAARLRG